MVRHSIHSAPLQGRRAGASVPLVPVVGFLCLVLFKEAVDYPLAEIPDHSHEFLGLLPKATGQPDQFCRSCLLTAAPEPLEVRN